MNIHNNSLLVSQDNRDSIRNPVFVIYSNGQLLIQDAASPSIMRH
jgi:hypothetical protein